ncbi:MAG: hypothetical protein L0241_17105 [Planctomycetia bacterium]|nr:hypothetical protein [Planctomycetia bacterium]
MARSRSCRTTSPFERHGPVLPRAAGSWKRPEGTPTAIYTHEQYNSDSGLVYTSCGESQLCSERWWKLSRRSQTAPSSRTLCCCHFAARYGKKIPPGAEQRFTASELPDDWPLEWPAGRYAFSEVYPKMPAEGLPTGPGERGQARDLRD